MACVLYPFINSFGMSLQKGEKYGAAMFMAAVAVVFLIHHGWTGWEAFVDESAHNETAAWSDDMIVWARDTVENLQSEFWQLAVQFALLAGVFKVIGVQAYEEDEEEVKQRLIRLEEKLDRLQETSQA